VDPCIFLSILSLTGKYFLFLTKQNISNTYTPFFVRAIFFANNEYLFNFGFLADPNSNLYSTNNFRCVVYDDIANQISPLWSAVVLTDFTQVPLQPKSDILVPSQYYFSLRCFGGATPNDGSSHGNILNVKWQDPTPTTI
jgi:hypothetical protein